MNNLTEEQVECFWSKVDVRSPDECWLWRRSVKSNGYGQVVINYIHYATHRLAYELTHGPITGERNVVCHTCDTPPCCNPAHLWLGTTKENIRDAAKKGRMGSANMDFKKAQIIRDLYVTKKYTQKELADIFGIHFTFVCHIIKNRRWRNDI